MSRLSLIDNSKTTHEVINGIHWWSNPMLSVKINSVGGVYSVQKGTRLKCCGESGYGVYSVAINTGKNVHMITTFQALFCYLAANVCSIQNTRLVKKDCNKGFTLDNIIICKAGFSKVEDEILFNISDDSQNTADSLGETDLLVEDITETPKFYKVTKGETSYITEDGAKFPTKELAKWHQEKVTKGKSNAEIALNYNGGYVMAEQLFLNEVVYNCSKPYEHFKDVMDNNDGVQEFVGESKCLFDFSKLDSGLATNFMRIPVGKTYTCGEEEAKVLQKILQDTQESFNKFNKSVSLFKSLYSEILK